MLIDQYVEPLAEIEGKFYEYKRDLAFIQKKIFDGIGRTLITKGVIINITPFNEERMGERLNGKVITAPICSDYCMKYHFDKSDRIVAIERYDTFLGRFLVEELFLYKKELTERLRLGSGSDLQRLSLFDHSFGRTERCLSFAYLAGTGIVEEYVYGKIGLEEIRTGRKEGDYRETFFYEGDKLVMIEMTWPSGTKRVTYTTKHPDFKKIRQETYQKMRAAIEKFPQPSYSALGIEAFLDQREPTLYLCVTENSQPSDLIADWGTEMTDVQVYDWQLDDRQLARCIRMVAEILVELKDDGVIGEKQIYFHQSQAPVVDRYPQVRNVFRKAGLTVK